MPQRLSISLAIAALFLLASLAGSDPVLAGCQMQVPELSIGGVTLLDAASAAAVVGTGAELIDNGQDMPAAHFTSRDGAEEFTLFAHNGAGLDQYAELQVGRASIASIALPSLPIDQFSSGLGVRLGMTVAEVLKVVGKCFRSRDRNGAIEILQYEITNLDKDDRLKSYGYPLYYAEYEFDRGKLSRFRFGFEYP